MLGWMRQKRNHAVALWIFIILTVSFIVGFGLNSSRMNAPGAGTGFAAKVYDEVISEGQVQNAMRNLVQNRPPQGASEAESVRSDALDGLVEEAVLLHEARIMGLEVTDEELEGAIQEIPSFIDQGSGQFDYQLYDGLYGSDAAKSVFEKDQRRMLLSRKITALLLASAQVSPVEVEAEFKRENTLMRLAVLTLDPQELEMDIALGEEDLKSHHEEHKAEYKKAEEREVEFLAADLSKKMGDLKPSDAEIKAYYDAHASEFKSSVEWKASHILIKADSAADETVVAEKQKAIQAVAARLKGGEDFAAVAKEKSEDASNAPTGGDLGWFGPGAMVKPFEEAVAAMAKGGVTGPVRTSFGFHMIRLDDVRGGEAKSLADVKGDIASKLAAEMKGKAQQEAEAALKALAEDTQKNANLKAWSEGEGKGWTTHHKTGLISRKAEQVEGVDSGLFYSFMDTAFNTAEKDVSGAFGNSAHMYVLRVLTVHPAEDQPLEAVKEKVKEDLMQIRRAGKAEETAKSLLADWKGGKDVPAEAKDKKGFAFTETEAFKLSEFSAPVIGANLKFSEGKYSLTANAPFMDEPLKSQGKVHLVKMLELAPASVEDLSSQSGGIQRRLQMQKAAMLIKNFTDSAVARAKEAGEIARY